MSLTAASSEATMSAPDSRMVAIVFWKGQHGQHVADRREMPAPMEARRPPPLMIAMVMPSSAVRASMASATRLPYGIRGRGSFRGCRRCLRSLPQPA